MMIISRLLHSKSNGFSRLFFATTISRNGRLLSTGSEKIVKSDEAGTFDAKKSPTGKLLVLGGNGFVGSHICREALKCGLTVSSLSRLVGQKVIEYEQKSGRPSVHDSWANDVIWHKGDLLSPGSLQAMSEATSVISCVGGFGSNLHMYRINGTANINAIRAAAKQVYLSTPHYQDLHLGVKRFVYVSAADFGFINYLLRGYYDGKRATEAELTDKFPKGGIILRPGFIHGTRQVGKMKLPLSVIGAPLQMVLQHAKILTRIPLIGPLLIPPVKVTSVAKVAVKAATDPQFPSGIVDVYGIVQLD